MKVASKILGSLLIVSGCLTSLCAQSAVPRPGSAGTPTKGGVAPPLGAGTVQRGNAPILRGFTPSPGGALPSPGASLPSPGGAVPSPGAALPTPGGAMPTPGGALPSLGGGTPTPGGSIPPLGGTNTTPGGGLPAIGGNTLTPGTTQPALGTALPSTSSNTTVTGGQAIQSAANARVGNANINQNNQSAGTMAGATNFNQANAMQFVNAGASSQVGRVNLPAQATFGSINQNAWFLNPNVQAQLNLNAQQVSMLNQLYTQQYGQYYQAQAQFNGTSSLTDEQRLLQAQAIQRFYQNLSSSSQNVFDANQRTRFNQLQLQYRGYQAFSDPAVAQRLNLTSAQSAKLRDYEQVYDQRLANIYKFQSVDPNIMSTRLGELRNDLNRRVDGVLSPEQQATWKQLTGEPYQFAVE
jgi:hypothetical protein